MSKRTPTKSVASSPSRPRRRRGEGRVGAVIVAAGESQRMRGIDKMFASVLGRPLLAHTIDPFERSPAVDCIVLVLHPQRLAQGEKLSAASGWKKVVRICAGGQRRQDSVKNGLAALPACQWVIVHDGARPCLEPGLLERGLAEARATGAAVAAVPAKDTVKLVGADHVVRRTPPRKRAWAVQTPQVFRYDLIMRAYQGRRRDATDDATLVERMGHPVKTFMGSSFNIKVTTPEDLAVTELFLTFMGRSQK